MNSEYASQTIVWLLLMILLSVLTMGMLMTLAVVRYLDRRKVLAARPARAGLSLDSVLRPSFADLLIENPARWLVIKRSNPAAVQTALGLHNVKPFSWSDGLSRLTDQALFISPPIDGWLLIVGPGLPDPVDDVDECYRFIKRLSRELGHVQFFSVNRALDHHAWVKAERDEIIRAYAWAGETLWNEGRMTHAELDLEMQCFDYAVTTQSNLMESSQANAGKVTALAARWSFDPTNIDARRLSAARGISGDLTHRG